MIKAILIFNNHGKPRLIKFYQYYAEDIQQGIVRETFLLVSRRDENVCNFLDGGNLIGGAEFKLIYRHYATLFFVFCVDSAESELGILDLIQVFVETLDKCFENVCELDLIFHVDKVLSILAELCVGGLVADTNMFSILTHFSDQQQIESLEVQSLLAELVMGGLALETNMAEILLRFDEQEKLERNEAGLASAPSRAVSAVKELNIQQRIKEIKLPDLPAIGSLKF